MIVWAPLVPVLPAASVWVAVTLYVPVADRAVANVNVQAPAVQVAVPFCVLAPVTATETVALSPAAVPQAPPTEVTVTLVVNGNVRAVPLTDVSVTTGRSCRR